MGAVKQHYIKELEKQFFIELLSAFADDETHGVYDWSEWEFDFLTSIKNKKYEELSSKQLAKAEEIYLKHF